MPNLLPILVLVAMLVAVTDAEATTAPVRPGVGLAVVPHDLCGPAIARAEAAESIPRGLLGAVALAESGRWDAERERLASWPWTVNNGGDGRYFASRGQAIAWVEELRRQGRSNIDVGCMQINLKHHPDAFASLAEAFEPSVNTSYAARFLAGLRRETGSWPRAVERYHTADIQRGRAYRERVYARLEDVEAAPTTHAGIEAAAADRSTPARPRGGLSSLWSVNRSLLAARGVALPPEGSWATGRRPVVLGPRPAGGGEDQADAPRRFFAIRRAPSPEAPAAPLTVANRVPSKGGDRVVPASGRPMFAAPPVAAGWRSIPAGHGRIGLASGGPFGAVRAAEEPVATRSASIAMRRPPASTIRGTVRP